jgi:hypothetical protein
LSTDPGEENDDGNLLKTVVDQEDEDHCRQAKVLCQEEAALRQMAMVRRRSAKVL